MNIETLNSVGTISELQGEAQVIRADGTEEALSRGMEVYQGDTINTADGASVNVTFSDDSNFAVSEDSSLVIDEYVYDGTTEAGVSNFSMLKGMFVYTSGMIGRDDPDDVHIETPVGSIGIRGTIIAGNIDNGEITVVEGAIVLTDLAGNEMTLASQFETGRFGQAGQGIEHVGNLSATEVLKNFDGVSDVSPDLFSSIHDAATEAPAQEQAPEGAEHNVELVEEESAEALEAETSDEGVAEDAQAVDGQDAPIMLETAALEGTDMPIGQPMPSMFARAMELGFEAIYNADGQIVGVSAPTVDALGAPVDPAVLQAQLIQQLFGTDPVHINNLPEAFWTVSNQMSWGHNFAQNFRDPDSGDQLQYFLTQNTIDGLQAAGVTGTLNPNTGQINFDFTSVTSDLDLDLTVYAVDRAGNTTSHTYNLDVATYDSAGGDVQMIDGTNKTLNASQDNIDVFGTKYDDDLTISDGSNGNAAFLGDGNDDAIVHGDDNVVYLGAGTNSAKFGTDATDNTAFGNDGKDTFEFQNLENQAYGFGNNDIFQMDIELLNDLQGDNGSFFKIEGAESESLNTLQDSLKLSGNGNIDFTQIDNGYIKGIELLDLTDSAGATANTMTLNVQDVIAMTDDDNFLRINADNLDQIDLSGFTSGDTNITEVKDLQAYTYNEFIGSFNGTDVTVYVETSAAGVTI